MKRTGILCDTLAKEKAVLKKFEKMGYEWMSGDKPTSISYFTRYGEDVVVIPHSEVKRVSVCRANDFVPSDIVEAEKFIGKIKPIVILFKGNKTTAVDKNVDVETSAVCMESDTFNYKTGALIALLRQIKKEDITEDIVTEFRRILKEADGKEEDKPVERKDSEDKKEDKEDVLPHDYSIGDCVTIRADVKQGKQEDGLYVTEAMLKDRGAKLVITDISFAYGMVRYICHSENNGDLYFYYSDGILEPYKGDDEHKSHDYKVGDIVTLSDDVEEGKTYDGLILYSGRMYNNAKGKKMKVVRLCLNDTYFCEQEDGERFFYSKKMLKPITKAVLDESESESKGKSDEFSVGDRVQIREWDEMLSDEGAFVNPIGSIGWTKQEKKEVFTSSMKELCGKKATITKIYNGNYELDFDEKDSLDTLWFFVKEFLKPIDEDDDDDCSFDNDFDDDELFDGDFDFGDDDDDDESDSDDGDNFKVGDKVCVVNNGATYTTYANWFTDNKIDLKYGVEFASGELPVKGDVGEIVAIAPHGFMPNNVLLIRVTKNKIHPRCYMISPYGVTKVDED